MKSAYRLRIEQIARTSVLHTLALDDRAGRENKGRKLWVCAICESKLCIGVKHFYWHATHTKPELRLCSTCQEKVGDIRRSLAGVS